MAECARVFRGVAVAALFGFLGIASANAQAVASGKDAFPVGGLHEFGGYVGHSWNAGPQLGYVRNTKFTSVVARYSYRIRNGETWNLRYSPEATLLADLFEPKPSPQNINTRVPLRSYGGGISPLGFQGVFLPRHHVQPFVNVTAGMLYYNNEVLSDGATHFMFTVDYGAGMNLFVKPRYAAYVGFRYQHQSNANVGQHNPGTDAELFYVGFSRFHTKGVR